MFKSFSDVRSSIRLPSKHRSFTGVAVLTLVLGIGAISAVFSMVDAILFRPYPFRDLERIVASWETISKVSAEHCDVSPANYFDWKEQNPVFEDMTAYWPWNATVIGPHEVEPVQGYLVVPGYFGIAAR